jgi:hypothetical protein
MTVEPETPEEGKRFSLVYLRNGELLRDDPRMRRRLSRLLYAACRPVDLHTTFDQLLGSELGEPGIFDARYQHRWDEYFGKAKLRVLLDLPSMARKALVEGGAGSQWSTIPAEINRIFAETEVGYTCDSKGGVRYVTDEAYEANVTSSIAALQGDRYKTAAGYIRTMDGAMTRNPPDGRDAMRAVFDAAENIFKQMTGLDQLKSNLAGERLEPLIKKHFANNTHAIPSHVKCLQSFRDWIDAAHFYRHEPGKAEPSQPPEALLILFVSQGVSFVRWLATLDRQSLGA